MNHSTTAMDLQTGRNSGRWSLAHALEMADPSLSVCRVKIPSATLFDSPLTPLPSPQSAGLD